MTTPSAHIPVLAQEIQTHLQLKPGDCFVDCTGGLGGHALLLAAQVGERGRGVVIDRDQDSLEIAKATLSPFSGRIDFVRDDFRNIDKILDQLGLTEVRAILFDLGVSSFQLGNPERGFSLMAEGPLDMRMDRESFLSAYDLINSLSQNELELILRKYGEERMSRRIARFLVDQRGKKPLQSTRELSDLVMRAMPAKLRHQRIHPATRTFQAFRIAVNRELEALEMALDKCLDYLADGGRLAVISFHSLEDRIVKQHFRSYAKSGLGTLITKKPIQAQEEEIRDNPRARSAKLRVLEKPSDERG